MTLNKISEKLLLAVKMQQSTTVLEEALKQLKIEDVLRALDSDQKKLAYWINCYNAFYQILRKENFSKPKIYSERLIEIGTQKFSLDDIEHGILRKYRFKLSLGYLRNPFVSSIIKKLAVSKLDYRIHFALNCGAKSCPPIAFYKAENINGQLEMATISFLESETQVYPSKKEVHTSRLFKWFIGDFGGTTGVLNLLSNKLKTDLKGFKIIYNDYSWEDDLGNFKIK